MCCLRMISVVTVVMMILGSRVLLAADLHEGKVVSAGDGVLTIVDTAGENEEFAVAKDAKITRNQEEVSLEELEAGDVVKVTVKLREGKLIAIVIHARSPK